MILDDIIRDKKHEIRRLKKLTSLADLKRECEDFSGRKNNFFKALKSSRGIAVIAEIKKRSPSKGLLSKNFDAVKFARSFARQGAGALSVLTDHKYFGGSSEILLKVRRSSSLPILRKDFTVDEYQLFESKLLDVQAVLLIVRILPRETLRKFYSVAQKLGLEVLFEVHDEADLKKVLPLKPRIVGINNRDLATFRVDLNITKRLAGSIPKECLVVSESGIARNSDLERLRKHGVHAVLVGEMLMKTRDPGSALKRLLGKRRASR